VRLGRLSVPFGLRWALLHRLGPLGRWIGVLAVTRRGQSQDRLEDVPLAPVGSTPGSSGGTGSASGALLCPFSGALSVACGKSPVRA
jgi:hypothetical protein